MKFGKLTAKELDQVNFALPEDHPGTTNLLSKSTNRNDPRIYVGCAKWGRPEWVGHLYPEGTKEKDFLANYVNHFNSIELNATFYGAKRSNMQRWAENGVDGFKFCPKFTRLISHIKRLKGAEEIVDYYLDAITSFGDHLGISFLQMPENFSPKKFDVFADFIEYLPDNAPVCVELRHPNWYNDPAIADETFDLLESNNIGTVITDVSGRRDCLHQRLTTTTAFIRFNGYDFHPTDFPRIDAWVDRISSWINQGIEAVYFFAHQEDERNTPKTADYFIEKINKKCGLSLKRPMFLKA